MGLKKKKKKKKKNTHWASVYGGGSNTGMRYDIKVLRPGRVPGEVGGYCGIKENEERIDCVPQSDWIS